MLGKVCQIISSRSFGVLLIGTMLFFSCTISYAQYSFTMTQAPFGCAVGGMSNESVTTSGSYSIGGLRGNGTNQSAAYNDSALYNNTIRYSIYSFAEGGMESADSTVSAVASFTATITGPIEASNYGVDVVIMVKSRCQADGAGEFGTGFAETLGSSATVTVNPDGVVHSDSGVQYNGPYYEMVTISGSTGKGTLTVGNWSASANCTGMFGGTDAHASIVVWCSQITGPYGTINFAEPANPTFP